ICHNVRPHEQGRLSRWLLPPTLKWVLGRGDGFIVHSQADEAILRLHLPGARIIVSPHPTYAALGEHPQQQLPIPLPTDCPLLLFCGLVRPYKGLDVLLDAVALLERPFHLLVAGEFWQGGYAEYQAQISNFGLTKSVTLVDAYLPNELLAAYIKRANVVVLPYRSATQSGMIQTAFGLGTPVITTHVGGLAEAVEDGRTGLVVPPENPQALAEAINNYFDHHLDEMFREKIKEDNDRFSWSHFIRQIENVSNLD
ncbi:MAG: glycosyltransferase, partial [Bacteroidetes bacterium]|nr:glycosyltransferase [Bacteroidota bacterium]